MKNGRFRVALAPVMPYHPVKVFLKLHALRLVVFGVILLTLLTGCIDIESNLTFSDSESGTVEFRYRMYTELFRATALETDPSRPMFPVLEADFERLARLHPKLQLLEYRRTESEDHVTVTVSLAFQSIEALNSALGGGDVVTVRTTEEQVVVLQQFGTRDETTTTSTAAPYGSADEVFGELIEGYRFLTRINAPRDLKQVQPEEATKNARTAELELPLSRLLDVQQPIQLEVSW